MHNPPANSYITEPTALTETDTTTCSRALNSPDANLRTPFVSHSFDRRANCSDPKVFPPSPTELNFGRFALPYDAPGSPLPRAVSMGELAQRESSKPLLGLLQSDVSGRQNATSNAIPHSFLLTTRPRYDSDQTNGALVGCTISRKPKQPTRTSSK